jgi:hypothetical protein
MENTMNNWLKRNPIESWKWYHWLASYLLFFAFCFTLLFIQHLVFGYPKHMGSVAFGVTTMVTIMASVDWVARHTGRKHR